MNAFVEFFATHGIVLLTYAVMIGLLVGSFLNVVIYRLPKMMERDWRMQCHEFLDMPPPATAGSGFDVFNLAKPDSHCPHCKHRISALENIPVFSYLWQRGKCKHCQAPISLRYPIMECVTATLSCLVVDYYGFSWLTLALLVFTWILIVLTMIDVDHQLLPDDLTLPLLWLGLLVNIKGAVVPLPDAVLGAIGGYLVLWVVYWAFKLLTGKEGMGYGDFKLLAAIGAWTGWQMLPLVVLLSSAIGAVVGISLIVFHKHGREVPIPFGPYLAGAGLIALFWGPALTQRYLALVL